MKEQAWEKIEPSGYWAPDKEGEEIVGVVINTSDGQYGTSWLIKKADNTEIKTPAHKVLINRMSSIKAGDVVRIVFDGSEAPKVRGQNPTMMYTVYKGRA